MIFNRNSTWNIVFKPNFYIAKLGYAGVYLFFLFLLQNIDCEYSLEPRVSTIYILSKNKKIIDNFLLKSFNFYDLKNLSAQPSLDAIFCFTRGQKSSSFISVVLSFQFLFAFPFSMYFDMPESKWYFGLM